MILHAQTSRMFRSSFVFGKSLEDFCGFRIDRRWIGRANKITIDLYAVPSSSWWFFTNPIEKYKLVEMGSSSPKFGMKIKNVWNHHLVIYYIILYPSRYSFYVRISSVLGTWNVWWNYRLRLTYKLGPWADQYGGRKFPINGRKKWVFLGVYPLKVEIYNPTYTW